MRSDKHIKKTIFSGINTLFRRTGSWFTSIMSQKFTVMFIPHSEKKVVNFQMSTLLLIFLAAVFMGMVGGFFYMTTHFTGSEQLISEQQDDLIITQGNLDAIRDEVTDTVKVFELFESSMLNTLRELELSASEDSSINQGGDLASINNLQEINNGEAREIYDLRQLRESLSGALDPLNNIASALQTRSEIMADLPTMWPVVGTARSIVTMEFGPNIHPVYGNWYMHKGIDIAASQSLPIVAAANGKVIESKFGETGFGNYVLIEHKYGFRTRYSHLQSRSVNAGDIVYQGQRIGVMGNTGLSTGRHLDFQIMLGTEVLDPTTFLNINNDFIRWSNSTRR